ncbi:caspase-3-like [Watersipora subatra]|uniref:caspase-3-like n=1 Tax=Watersipora subatra TaxID=2589382 RepID=UPI00355BA70A
MSGPVPPSEPMQVDTSSSSQQNRTLNFNYIDYEDEHFAYPRCQYKGYVVILNNEDFTYVKVHGKKRLGSHYDAEGLREVLLKLGFKSEHIRVEKNKTKVEMKAILQEVSRRDFTDFNCLIVAVFSFGEQNFKVYSTDDQLAYHDIVSPFQQCVVPTLFDKPKLFLVQSEPSMRLSNDTLPPEVAAKVTSEPDVLFVYSHDDEDIAWKDERKGTWFIQSLIEVLRQDGKRLDMMNIMTRVNYLTRRFYESYVKDNAAQANCPYIYSLLTKTFNLEGGHVDP